jgi:hypothetical protein
MSIRPPDDPITMERRHILEGKKRVARQERLVEELVRKGHSELALTAADLLYLLRDILAISWERLRPLEQDRRAKRPE